MDFGRGAPKFIGKLIEEEEEEEEEEKEEEKEKEQRHNVLFSWAAAHGVVFDGIVLEDFVVEASASDFWSDAPLYRGVMATKVFEDKAPVVTIPVCVCMSSLTARRSTELLRFCEAYPDLDPYDLLTLHIIIEKHKGEKSFWAPFLATLPLRSELGNIPIFFTKEKMSRVPDDQRTDISKCVFRRRLNISKCYNGIVPLFRRHDPQVGGQISLDDFCWATAIIMSRTYGVDYDENDNSLQGLHTLVPIADMFNHNQNGNYIDYIDGENGHPNRNYDTMSLVVRARGTVRPGQQVFIRYSDEDDDGAADHFLFNYGFVPP